MFERTVELDCLANWERHDVRCVRIVAFYNPFLCASRASRRHGCKPILCEKMDATLVSENIV